MVGSETGNVGLMGSFKVCLRCKCTRFSKKKSEWKIENILPKNDHRKKKSEDVLDRLGRSKSWLTSTSKRYKPKNEIIVLIKWQFEYMSFMHKYPKYFFCIFCFPIGKLHLYRLYTKVRVYELMKKKTNKNLSIYWNYLA